MSLVPVPSEPELSACANCSAPLALDQRYCLACGQPVTPVRLAFLDVLQADAQPAGAGYSAAGSLPAGYGAVVEPAHSLASWMRRYSGLLGLLSVLLLAIIAGLLVGHWITQSKSPAGPQVVKVEGLTSGAAPAVASAPAATATTAATSTAASKTPKPAAPTATKSSAKTEAKEVKEAKAIEKAPPPKAVKVNSNKIKKLGSSSGKKHEEEINSLGAQPIETGG